MDQPVPPVQKCHTPQFELADRGRFQNGLRFNCLRMNIFSLCSGCNKIATWNFLCTVYSCVGPAFVIAWLLTALAFPTGASAVEENAARRPERADRVQAGTPYYIEFRVARIGTYGHSYVAYGRLNAQGRPAEHRYADLHPTGNYALMAIGHVLPVPANTKWDPEVLTLPVSSSYRRKLTAAQYKKLLAAIQRLQSEQRYWNAVTNNCNHYVGELARAVGLRTPGNFQLSYAFIPALRELNEISIRKQSNTRCVSCPLTWSEHVLSRGESLEVFRNGSAILALTACAGSPVVSGDFQQAGRRRKWRQNLGCAGPRAIAVDEPCHFPLCQARQERVHHQDGLRQKLNNVRVPQAGARQSAMSDRRSAVSGGRCPLWVISGQGGYSPPCLLYLH